MRAVAPVVPPRAANPSDEAFVLRPRPWVGSNPFTSGLQPASEPPPGAAQRERPASPALPVEVAFLSPAQRTSL